MEKAVKIYFPRWVSLFYVLCAIVLIPWIALLAEVLPAKHVARHWDALWVGFDMLILLTILVTVYFVIRRKVWVIMSASALATLLIVDIWFDVLTARPGHEEFQAFLSGIVELLLAILTFRLVFHVLHQATPEKNLDMSIESKKSYN